MAVSTGRRAHEGEGFCINPRYRAGHPTRLARRCTPKTVATSCSRSRLAAKNRPSRRRRLSFSSPPVLCTTIPRNLVFLARFPSRSLGSGICASNVRIESFGFRVLSSPLGLRVSDFVLGRGRRSRCGFRARLRPTAALCCCPADQGFPIAGPRSRPCRRGKAESL